MVTAEVYAQASRPRRVLGRSRPGAALAHPVHAGPRLVQPALRDMVRRRRAQRRVQLPRSPRGGGKRRARRPAVGGRAGRFASRHLCGADRRGQAIGQRAGGTGHRRGRPCGHLHADDPRGHRGHAGGGAAGCDPLGRLRRVLGRQPARPHRRRRREARDHRRRRLPQGQGLTAQARCRHGAGRPERLGRAGDGGERAGRAARRQRRELDRGPRHLVARRRAPGIRRAPGARLPGRESAVHPLHLRHDRKAEGDHAHLGRLSDAGGVQQQDRPRPAPGDGCVLVHGRHRLGHGALLRHVRSARERRDAGAVRRHARHPSPRPMVGDRPEVRRHGPVHRADRHPLVHEARTGDPEQYDLSSLRLLGSVGEPINPEAWMWYRKIIGGKSAPSWTRGGRPRPARS